MIKVLFLHFVEDMFLYVGTILNGYWNFDYKAEDNKKA